MQVSLGNQQSELQRQVAEFTVEQNGHGMHQHFPLQAATQVSAITGPDAFDSTAVNSLTKGSVDAIAGPTEECAPSGAGIALGTTSSQATVPLLRSIGPSSSPFPRASMRMGELMRL